MNLNERIEALTKLGTLLQKEDEAKQAAVHLAKLHNPWFTKENSENALHTIATEFLNKEKLEAWLTAYPNLDNKSSAPKSVGLVLAGNIPAVGFQDVITVFITGNKALIKLSDKDKYLIQYLISALNKVDERTKDYFTFVPMLKEFDGVIATGSNNSSVYFERYFSKKPNIIRKNRNSVAILTGKETKKELKDLATDVFKYFGLGCRSVSKIYVPEDYDFIPLMEALDDYKEVMDHTKYRNNFDYNRSVYLLNRLPHLVNDCIMVLEDSSPLSRIATLHYQKYSDLEKVQKDIEEQKEQLQCVATQLNLSPIATVKLGETQTPALNDYADGVDTVAFLLSL
ncbi:MAG: acyl-CoA reductase [Aureispira sp.]|nr:acyl-CoA reductase [Aureispira sp.]